MMRANLGIFQKNNAQETKATPIKDFVTQNQTGGAEPKTEEMVITRPYIKSKATAAGIYLTDDDITYDDANGEVYVRGQSIGKVAEIDDKGQSKMVKSMIDTGLDNAFNNIGSNPIGDKGFQNTMKNNLAAAVGQSVGWGDEFRRESLRSSSAATDHYMTDPMAKYADWWNEAEEIFGAIGKDEGKGIAAGAGTGSNIDTASLSATKNAENIRLKDALDYLTNMYINAGQKLVDNAAGIATNYETLSRGDANTIGAIADAYGVVSEADNQTKQTDATIGQMDAEITGRVTAEQLMRNNPWFSYDENGNPYLNNVEYDYGKAIADLETQGKGNSVQAAFLRQAQSFRQGNYDKYAGDTMAGYQPVQTESASEFDQSLQHENELSQAEISSQNATEMYSLWEDLYKAGRYSDAELILQKLLDYYDIKQ